MDERPDRSARLTGGLLVVASAVLAVSAAPGVPDAVETVAFALVGTAVACFADLRLRNHGFALVLMTVVLVAIGDRLGEHATALDRPWALPVAMGGYLLFTACVAAPRVVLRAAVPAIAAVAVPLLMRGTASDALWMSVPMVPIALLAALAGVPRIRASRSHTELTQNQHDLDAVVMANLELRNVGDPRDAADRIARIATELLEADGAVVWLQGPGRLLCAGGHGVTPPPERAIDEGSIVEHVLVTGTILAEGSQVVLPLTASGGVFGAVEVSNPRRCSATFVASVLQLFGAEAGYALERLRAVEGLIDARFIDPVTGVGNRLAASASLATLHPGDAVLLLAVEEVERIRAEQGDARADLILGQLGLHLRTATRAGDVIARFGDDVFFLMLRDLNSCTESVVTRLLESWQQAGAAGELHAGAALHFADSTPLDTLDRASEALDAGRFGQRDRISVAAEHESWGPEGR